MRFIQGSQIKSIKYMETIRNGFDTQGNSRTREFYEVRSDDPEIDYGVIIFDSDEKATVEEYGWYTVYASCSDAWCATIL